MLDQQYERVFCAHIVHILAEIFYVDAIGKSPLSLSSVMTCQSLRQAYYLWDNYYPVGHLLDILDMALIDYYRPYEDLILFSSVAVC